MCWLRSIYVNDVLVLLSIDTVCTRFKLHVHTVSEENIRYSVVLKSKLPIQHPGKYL